MPQPPCLLSIEKKIDHSCTKGKKNVYKVEVEQKLASHIVTLSLPNYKEDDIKICRDETILNPIPVYTMYYVYHMQFTTEVLHRWREKVIRFIAARSKAMGEMARK